VRLTVGSKSEESPIAHGNNPTFQFVTYLLVKNAQAQRLRVDVEEADAKSGVAGTIAGGAKGLVGKGAKSLGYYELLLDDVARQVTGFQDKYQLTGVRYGTIEMAVVLRFIGPNVRDSIRFDDMKKEREAELLAMEAEPDSPTKPRRMSALQLSRGMATGEARSGVLKVTVLEARNLPDVNGNGFSDPYASLVCERTKHKTKTQKKTINPQWNESFEFPVTDANTAELTVSIKDHEQLGRNVLLGAVKFPVSFFGPQRVEEYVLEKATGEKTRGTFKLQTEFVEKKAPGSISKAPSVDPAGAAAAGGSTGSLPLIPEDGEAGAGPTSAAGSAASLSVPGAFSTPARDSHGNPVSPAEDRGLLRAASTISTSNECPVPEALLSTAFPPRSGVLKLHVIQASKLMAANTNGFSDPYVSIRLDGQPRKEHTKTIKRTVNPVWDEKFELPIKNTAECFVVLQVKDWERLGKNQMLGGVTIPLACVGNDTVTHTFPLVGFCGTLTVAMYLANPHLLAGAAPSVAATPTPATLSSATPLASSGVPGREESIGLPYGAAPLPLPSPLARGGNVVTAANVSSSSAAAASLPSDDTGPRKSFSSAAPTHPDAAPQFSSLVTPATPSAGAYTDSPLAQSAAFVPVPVAAGRATDYDGFDTPTGSIVSQSAAEAAAASVAAQAASQAGLTQDLTAIQAPPVPVTITEDSPKALVPGNVTSDDFVMIGPDASSTPAAAAAIAPVSAALAPAAGPPPASPATHSAVLSAAGSHLDGLGDELHASEATSLAEEPIHDDRPPLSGKLSLRILRANNLVGANSDGTSDPYVTVTLERNKHKTKTIKKSLSPEWTEPAWVVKVLNLHTAVLAFQVKDHETFGRNHVIGTASLRVESAQHGTDIEVPLQPQGVLYVRVDATPDQKQTLLV
jgi:hypothetical protein